MSRRSQNNMHLQWDGSDWVFQVMGWVRSDPEILTRFHLCIHHIALDTVGYRLYHQLS